MTKQITNDQLNAMDALGGNVSALVAEVRAYREQATAATLPTEPPASPLRVGNNVFIRTVTVYHVGRVEMLTDAEIVLSSASWVADTGRFHDAIRTGKLNEVEPFVSPISVNRGSVVDVTDWTHQLPRSQK